MTADAGADLFYDPADLDVGEKSHGIWHRLRDEQPVYRNEQLDFWALSRFSDVWDAYHDTATYSSSHGVNLESVPRVPDVQSIIYLDPPEHEVMRKLVTRAFTPRRINDLESHATELVDAYLDPFVGSEGFDFVEDFGSRLAPMMIGHLLGVPTEDREKVGRWFDNMLHRDEGETAPSRTATMARIAMYRYATALVAERKQQPRDDMVSVLIAADVDDAGETRELTDLEVVNFILLLAGAGVETTSRALGWAAVTLARNPDQRQILVDEPSLIPNAFEELLRFEAPAPVIGRWTPNGFERHGVRVPPESKVLLLLGSANRDGREFADPDRFDVRRSIKRHIAFGHGAHYCIGAALARMEARVALAGALKRFPTWDIDESELVRVNSVLVRGFSSVPVHLR